MRILLIILLLLPAMAWGQDSVVFQDDGGTNAYNDCRDAKVRKGSQEERNRGAELFLDVGVDTDATSDTHRVVIKFPNFQDEGSFTATEIDSGRISLYFYGGQNTNNHDFVLHQIPYTEPWSEGNTAAADDSNYVSWTYRTDSTLTEATHTGDTAWATGGVGTANPLDTTTIGDAVGVWYHWVVPKAVCSTWAATSSKNTGVMLRGDDETPASDSYKYARSRDYSTAADRPKLTIYYTTATTTVYGAGTYGAGTYGGE